MRFKNLLSGPHLGKKKGEGGLDVVKSDKETPYIKGHHYVRLVVGKGHHYLSLVVGKGHHYLRLVIGVWPL